MIPFNLPHNPKPSPAIRKPNPLRASGPYYHICYVRCAISNLRPPNCFYNMSPVHPRFLFSQCLSLSSFSLALSTSLKCPSDKRLRARSFSSSDSFRSSQFKLNATQLGSARLDSTRTFATTINFIQLIARCFATLSLPKGE